MSNIVLIEDDDKVIREITRFVGELSEGNNLRIFKTPEQFIKRYSKSTGTSELAASAIEEGFNLFTDEQLESLKAFDFVKDQAFKDENLKLVMASKDQKILKITMATPSPIFELSAEQLIANENAMKTLIPDNHLTVWEKLLESTKEKNPSASFLPISVGGKAWLIFIELEAKAGELQLTLSNYSGRALVIINKSINERGESDVKELDMLSSIDLVIVKNGLIEDDTPTWINLARNHLKANTYFPEEGSTRFVVTKYEDDGVPKSALFHAHIDDMITLPLDRLLFLQKLQIILSLPEMAKPQFLFLQPVDEKIDISKKTKLEHLNDIGLALRNPVALTQGIPTTVYFKFPTSESPLRVETKSSHNEKHTEEPNNYKAFFGYFGIDKKEHMKIKQFLRERVEYKDLKSQLEDDFAFHPENIFLTESQKRVKNIVILDIDDQKKKQLTNSIMENMSNITCIAESSLYIFEKKYLQTGEDEVIPLKEHELYDKQIVWKIDADRFDLVLVVNEPTENDKICGHSAEKFFESKKDWKFLFEDEHSQELVINNLNNIKTARETTIYIDIIHADKSKRMAKLFLRHENDQIEMCLMPPEPDDLEGDVIESVDAIVLDVRMIPKHFEEWRTELQERIDSKKLNPRGGLVPIIAVADPKEFTKDDMIRTLRQDISALILWPVESKALCYHVSRLVDSPFTRYKPDNLGWANVLWNAYAAKQVNLVEISEFGCIVRTKRPLRIGTTVFLHGFIYKNAPDENLCARLYYYEKDPHEDGDYLCYLLYFGINDSFLKYTRSWIRENYAQLKAKS